MILIKVNNKYISIIILIFIIIFVLIYYKPVSFKDVYQSYLDIDSIDRISIMNEEYRDFRHHMYRVNNRELIQSTLDFLGNIKIQRKANQNNLSYNRNENGEYELSIKYNHGQIVFIRIYNNKYIDIDGKIYKIINEIDYNQLLEIINNNN